MVTILSIITTFSGENEICKNTEREKKQKMFCLHFAEKQTTSHNTLLSEVHIRMDNGKNFN